MKRTLVQCRRLKSAKHEIKSHSWQIFANPPTMRLLVQCRRLSLTLGGFAKDLRATSNFRLLVEKMIIREECLIGVILFWIDMIGAFKILASYLTEIDARQKNLQLLQLSDT